MLIWIILERGKHHTAPSSVVMCRFCQSCKKIIVWSYRSSNHDYLPSRSWKNRQYYYNPSQQRSSVRYEGVFKLTYMNVYAVIRESQTGDLYRDVRIRSRCNREFYFDNLIWTFFYVLKRAIILLQIASLEIYILYVYFVLYRIKAHKIA